MTTIPVILAGGSGSRLWPLSREAYPKQFLRLASQHSLLQETVLRAKKLPDLHAPLIICNEAHYFLCIDQLAEIKETEAEFIIEPMGRNTAPAIAIAALFAINQIAQDATLLVMPSDHIIKDSLVFTAAASAAVQIAKEGKLVTFGIVPNEPQTGYGYIKAEKRFQHGAYHVDAFVEKPHKEKAIEFLKTGHYYWNSGIFVFNARAYLEELNQHAPDIYDAAHATYQHSLHTHKHLNIDKQHFIACRNQSIDYAVMEHTDKAIMVPLSAGWSDVGCWNAVSEISTSDDNNNVSVGNVYSQNTKNCYLRSEENFLSTIGVSDLIVINTPDSVLVAHKNCSQQIKDIVDQLKQQQNKVAYSHPKIYHSWGYKEVLTSTGNLQISHLMLQPNKDIPVQLTGNNIKHLVVAYGTMEVAYDNNLYCLEKGQSIDIPQNMEYRLKNLGKEELHLIKVNVT